MLDLGPDRVPPLLVLVHDEDEALRRAHNGPEPLAASPPDELRDLGQRDACGTKSGELAPRPRVGDARGRGREVPPDHGRRGAGDRSRRAGRPNAARLGEHRRVRRIGGDLVDEACEREPGDPFTAEVPKPCKERFALRVRGRVERGFFSALRGVEARRGPGGDPSRALEERVKRCAGPRLVALAFEPVTDFGAKRDDVFVRGLVTFALERLDPLDRFCPLRSAETGGLRDGPGKARAHPRRER